MHFKRLEHFTFWHFHRSQSYTSTHRKRMVSDREIYLAHLARWLEYEDTSTFPPLARSLTAQQSVDAKGFAAAQKALKLDSCNRVDSLVDTESPMAVLVIAEGHTLKSGVKLKQVASAYKVLRMNVPFPLPSYERNEADEQFADGLVEEMDSGARLVRIVVQSKECLPGIIGAKEYGSVISKSITSNGYTANSPLRLSNTSIPLNVSLKHDFESSLQEPHHVYKNRAATAPTPATMPPTFKLPAAPVNSLTGAL